MGVIHSIINANNFGNSLTLTKEITPPGGGKTITAVIIPVRDNAVDGRTVDTVKFNGTEVLLLAVAEIGGAQTSCFIYYIVNPTNTTANLVITMKDNAAQIFATIVHMTDMNIISPLDAVAGDSVASDPNSPIGGTLTTICDGAIILDGVVIDDDDGFTMDAETARVERLHLQSVGNCEAGTSTTETVTAGLYPLGWDKSGLNETWAWAAASFCGDEEEPPTRNRLI